jgi:DNA processing protein
MADPRQDASAQSAISPDEFAAWLRLLETPGVGRETARRLLAAFGSAEAIFDASRASIGTVSNAAVASALGTPPPEYEQRLAAARAWLDGGPGRSVLTLGDPLYPKLLLQAADPPLLLYVQGSAALLSAPSVAVVGSRNPTPQGADNARQFAAGLSGAGLVVVSGLALGIDGAAHDGALTGGAGTIAVVGTGLDRVYPARHRSLAHRIAEAGALVSEYAPGTPPLPENFPQRNRIIAGLSLGTLVVEAALQSGSLITARLALESDREVFAIPGSIQSALSRGCHALIRQGAMLVESPVEIADALRGFVAAPAAAARPDVAPSEAMQAARPHDPVLAALGHDPVTLDEMISRTGWPAHELAARLLDLELAGQVARLPGGLYQRQLTV